MSSQRAKIVAKSAQQDLEQALRRIAKHDSVIRTAIKRMGMPTSRKRPAGFVTLAQTIVGQQISTNAATAIWGRFKDVLGAPNAANVLNAEDTVLRSAGLSANKVKTLKAIASAIEKREINFKTFNQKSDEEIRKILTNIWGIGDWTADIYLMFAMGRPDVWPIGDLALRTGWQTITGASDRIEANELAHYAEQWRPYRSAAAVFLWHAVAIDRGF